MECKLEALKVTTEKEEAQRPAELTRHQGGARESHLLENPRELKVPSSPRAKPRAKKETNLC